METLSKTFAKYGYNFIQVKREGRVAIYEQRNADNNNLMAYEVFEIQEYPDQLVGPKLVPKPAREARPGSESWGRLGFTCHTLDRAEQLFDRLMEKFKNRTPKKSKKK